MFASTAVRRIQKDQKEVMSDPPANCSAGPVDENDPFTWLGTIMGPEETPYVHGIFFLSIKFPANYPDSPPSVKFTTQIYHPNVSEDGSVCVDILKPESWIKDYNISKVLLAINCLLVHPNPNSCLNHDAGQLYNKDKLKYDQTVKEWTVKYAMGYDI